jgi:hypothetical protein
VVSAALWDAGILTLYSVFIAQSEASPHARCKHVSQITSHRAGRARFPPTMLFPQTSEVMAYKFQANEPGCRLCKRDTYCGVAALRILRIGGKTNIPEKMKLRLISRW